MQSSEKQFLRLVPLSSFVQASFWNKLAEVKINVDKLSEKERDIWGYFYSQASSNWKCRVLEVDSTSFNKLFDDGGHNSAVPFHGKLFNKNTIEQFKDCDKVEMINREGTRFLENIQCGQVLENPSLINYFLLLTFSDLKKYHFYYWFAFPVPHDLELLIDAVKPIAEQINLEQQKKLSLQYFQLDVKQRSYFVVDSRGEISTLSSKLPNITEESLNKLYFAFTDFLEVGDNKLPKTQLKNYIVFLLRTCPLLSGKSVRFLLFHLDRTLSPSSSIIYNLTLLDKEKVSNIQWAGWEKNEKNKFAPRFSNMKATMDPKILFEESVDLNLKLMKWRLLPDIDLDKIKNLKCLLLGAGTLGCSVARTLLGWGVRNITFVDNSTVSFSNPVRQSLYTYEDSVQSKPKAHAASDNLKKIFPTINSQWYQLTIPMPGHCVDSSSLEATKQSIEQLTKLMQEHDIIFLLTDSRESRWLPTLLGSVNNKSIINVALGFDSYLVMRYGGHNRPSEVELSSSNFKKVDGHDLGCYFCNDVTAPGNSLKDRTLDQQCTVTRPGVSSIAGALAVELAVSLSQHPLEFGAPAYYKMGYSSSDNDESSDERLDQSILGTLPHSIRGFLSSFTHVLPATPKYDKCIACSGVVLAEFRSRGFDFLLDCFNGSKYLEDLTGLSELMKDEHLNEIIEMSDGDEWE